VAGAKTLAREIVRTRRVAGQLYMNKVRGRGREGEGRRGGIDRNEHVMSKRNHTTPLFPQAHLIDMNARLTEQLGVVKVAGTLKKSTEVMALVNRLVTVPQLAATVRAMGREMMRAGVIDEVMGDAIDSVMDGPEAEGEVDAEVDKVLAEVAGADVEALAGARAPATRVAGAGRAEEAAGEEGEELDELKARLEAVRAG